MIPLTTRLFIPLPTVLGSDSSLVHPCVDLRGSPKKLLKFMKQMSPKTCVLDLTPTVLQFECSNKIIPLLTTIVNQSLLTGTFSSCMKAAIFKPLLKKTSLDPNVLWNNLGLFQICPLCPNLLRKLFLTSFFVISVKTIFGTPSSQLITQNTVLR